MYSFSYLEPVCCSMSSSNWCFLTCIWLSQETSQVVWYSHLFQHFPQFIVIHTVKGFGIVNKAEIDVFLELFCFLDDSVDVGNLISIALNTIQKIIYFYLFIWSIVCLIIPETVTCVRSGIFVCFVHCYIPRSLNKTRHRVKLNTYGITQRNMSGGIIQRLHLPEVGIQSGKQLSSWDSWPIHCFPTQ